MFPYGNIAKGRGGTMLRKLRKSLKLTQEDVAKAAKISLVSYKRYEYGSRKPDVETAIHIANALHTTVEQLWGDSPTTA